MPKISSGKVLLRNVIRQTDAHNKIQEECEMWKLRALEQQTSSTDIPKHRGRMHCDRYLGDSEGSMRDQLSDRRDEMSEKDERDARYWTRKLYEFEASNPDRWGHSGFKELYPEEFRSDGEKDCTDRKHKRKKRKNKLDADGEKSSKKSSKKKKKKKEKKRRRTTTAASGSETCSDADDTTRRKQRRKGGKSKRRKKENKNKERAVDSSTEDSRSDERTRAHRKRHCLETDTQTEPQRKKRKNWKVANEEKSEESSDV